MIDTKDVSPFDLVAIEIQRFSTTMQPMPLELMWYVVRSNKYDQLVCARYGDDSGERIILRPDQVVELKRLGQK